jgi:hypothetical protein
MAYYEAKTGLISPYVPNRAVAVLRARQIPYDEQGFENEVAVGHLCRVWKANARLNDGKAVSDCVISFAIGSLTPLSFVKYSRQVVL